jgi:alkylated DNA nucleotide flippase Atl1
VACLLALAHRFENLVRSGEVRDYAEIARLGGVSRARVSQILKLLTLAPSIQEQILFLPRGLKEVMCERDLRRIVREPRWDRQRELFARILNPEAKPESR